MGLPALQQEHAVVARRPHLRVVKPNPKGNARRKPRACSNAVALQNFAFFAVVVLLVAGLGLGRVWLSVQAAQASLDSSRLRREIKLEQYQGDMLEVQESALATPSRIQAIAGGTMGMAPAASVSYLRLDGGRSASGADIRRPVAATVPQGQTAAALAKVMQAAASEASVLLVGDVGLASSR